jgi:hypothetical protein
MSRIIPLTTAMVLREIPGDYLIERQMLQAKLTTDVELWYRENWRLIHEITHRCRLSAEYMNLEIKRNDFDFCS